MSFLLDITSAMDNVMVFVILFVVIILTALGVDAYNTFFPKKKEEE